MSELSDKVEAAVLDGLANSLPGPVTGFCGTVSYLGDDGEPRYVMFDMPDQRLNVSLGMVRALSIFYDQLFISSWEDEDELGG